MMGRDMIEDSMERIQVPAARMTGDQDGTTLLNPVMLQDWSMITFAAVASRRIDPLPRS